MDFAVEFITHSTTLRYINAVCHYKRVIYPFELCGFTGRIRTYVYLKQDTTSTIHWESFPQGIKPASVAWKAWLRFLKWLVTGDMQQQADMQLVNISEYLLHTERNIIIKQDCLGDRIYFVQSSTNVNVYEHSHLTYDFNYDVCTPCLVRQYKKTENLILLRVYFSNDIIDRS